MQYEYEDDKTTGLSLKTWLRLIPYFMKMKKQFFIAFLVVIFWTLLGAAMPLFTRHAVDNFVIPGSTDGVVPFALLYFAFALALAFLTYLYVKILIHIDVKIGLMIRRDCFIHLQKLQLSYHNTNSVGYIIGRVMSDTERICGMLAWGFAAMLEASLVIMFSIMFMIYLNLQLAVVLIIIIPCAGLIAWIFQRKIMVISRKVRETNSRITGAYNEGITGSKTSKTLVIEDVNSAAFSELSNKMQRQSVRSSRLSAMMMPMVMSLGSIALSIILYRGGILVGRELIDYGILSAFITYAVSTIEPIVWVSGVITEMVSAQVGVERVTGLLGEEITITDPPDVVEKYGDTYNPKIENWEPILGGVTFDDVTFMYPDGDENVLENFSLDIPPGTTVAIVGETGAGKSTIVNLACRFYEPTGGRVLIDGRDAQERSQLWLHSSLGYVLQDPHLFSGTIMENIRYGRLDATDDEVRAAAKIVSADIVAERMPDGYDFEVGEGGDKLSTGEKQLVSFARAVLADPPIFVLDEATSSIDTETEQLIQNAISHILEGRTSFIIAHRLSTISRADIILVVEDGKIVERGTHAELIAAGGHYNELYTAMRLEESDI
ncbi:MAG: ABC transporter ATP-binding protein/permease [Oscillospiraceae bacterium]|jgi:ATP-binding cassette subfamily B protein|nr:ABC transporter ATP-binding protein/permease [Oscillospiraceae bacterium]